jgi:hydrogenase nickel incorporation protein HypA/HybF
MHELSIALNMVDIASETARQNGAGRVETLYLKLGALSGVAKDALYFSWELACAGVPELEGSRLEIEEIPVVVRCARCRQDGTLETLNKFVCPNCSAFVSTVVAGRELEITALEIV